MFSVSGAAGMGLASDGDEKLLVATGAVAMGVNVSANVGAANAVTMVVVGAAASTVELLDRLVCVLVVLGV